MLSVVSYRAGNSPSIGLAGTPSYLYKDAMCTQKIRMGSEVAVYSDADYTVDHIECGSICNDASDIYLETGLPTLAERTVGYPGGKTKNLRPCRHKSVDGEMVLSTNGTGTIEPNNILGVTVPTGLVTDSGWVSPLGSYYDKNGQLIDVVFRTITVFQRFNSRFYGCSTWAIGIHPWTYEHAKQGNWHVGSVKIEKSFYDVNNPKVFYASSAYIKKSGTNIWGPSTYKVEDTTFASAFGKSGYFDLDTAMRYAEQSMKQWQDTQVQQFKIASAKFDETGTYSRSGSTKPSGFATWTGRQLTEDEKKLLVSWAIDQIPNEEQSKVTNKEWSDLARDCYRNVQPYHGNTFKTVTKLTGVVSTLDSVISALKDVATNPRAWKRAQGIANTYLGLHYGVKLSKSGLISTLEQIQSLLPIAGNELDTHARQIVPIDVNTRKELTYTISYHSRGAQNYVDEFFYRIDLYPSLANMWDWNTYTFVVDWFVHLKSFLQAIDGAFNLNTTFDVDAVCETVKVVKTLTKPAFIAGISSWDVEAKYYLRRYIPTMVIPSIEPFTSNPFTVLQRVAGAGALVVQRIE